MVENKDKVPEGYVADFNRAVAIFSYARVYDLPKPSEHQVSCPYWLLHQDLTEYPTYQSYVKIWKYTSTVYNN